jgi:polyisoprenoid-binding protein YceI
MKLSHLVAMVLVCTGFLARANAANRVDFDLKQSTGSVEFHATGHPSALKIVGKGDKAVGHFVLEGDTVTGDSSFHLASLDTFNETRNHHMKEKYLEVDKFPEAKLTLAKLKLPKELSDNVSLTAVPFEGKLSLHGVEKPVKGTVNLERKGAQVTVTAQFAIKILDFGITLPTFLGITMADDVQVTVANTVSFPK